MKNFKVGLQLYSIRDDMQKDMDAALKQVKDMGYDYVEFAGFFDRSAEDIKAMLKKYDLTAVSVHQGPQSYLEQGQKAIDFLVEIGLKFCAIPWFELHKIETDEEWNRTMNMFSDYGKALKQSGIQLLYHNHDFEFKKKDGKYLLDIMYDTIKREYLKPEIDTCWVSYADIDPCEYIEKYSGCLDVLHLKDYVCTQKGGAVYDLIGDNGEMDKKADAARNGFEFRAIGHGVQNFPAILEAAEKAGVEYLIVEQDDSTQRPMMEECKLSREYLKSLGI